MYVNASTDIGGSTEPAYPVNAVFVGGQYSSGTTVNNGYELLPRDTSDFVHITVLSVTNAYSGIPTSFTLENNYPNPFNPSTTILYGIAQASRVTVKVYSVLGQEVATLVNGVQGRELLLGRVEWNKLQRQHGKQRGLFLSYFRCSCGWKVTNVHASEEDDVDEVSVKQSC